MNGDGDISKYPKNEQKVKSFSERLRESVVFLRKKKRAKIYIYGYKLFSSDRFQLFSDLSDF